MDLNVFTSSLRDSESSYVKSRVIMVPASEGCSRDKWEQHTMITHVIKISL
jgi:hypothetical protein